VLLLLLLLLRQVSWGAEASAVTRWCECLLSALEGSCCSVLLWTLLNRRGP